MFTGIIEEIGVIKNITANSKSGKITILANKILEDTNLGDSIAVNGVCLTVSSINKNEFVADIMMETIRATNLGKLNIKDKVNLERAMSISSRFGGHIVTGHVDTVGIIQEFKREENAVWVSIRAEEEFLKNMIYKGSIAIDGISLTVAYVDNKIFKVSIIPHTKSKTTILEKNVGNIVNLESDVIGKYIRHFLDTDTKENNNKNVKNSIDLEFLIKNGF
ncbi:MAG: riboflavin synthase [Peptostreptococcaceae bacterium]|nr:riboflavin synthase [Peptostreptococcaceae bacterium]